MIDCLEPYANCREISGIMNDFAGAYSRTANGRQSTLMT